MECQLAEFAPRRAFGAVAPVFGYADRCTPQQERLLRFKLDILCSMPELNLRGFIRTLTERLWEFPWEQGDV